MHYTSSVLERTYQFWVYLLASKSRTLYVGMTNRLGQRLLEHQSRMAPNSFTARYNINRLVYFQEFAYVNNAIQREKELKDWSRTKKIALIESMNPTWEDLSDVWWRRDPITALSEATAVTSGCGLPCSSVQVPKKTDSFASLRNDKQGRGSK